MNRTVEVELSHGFGEHLKCTVLVKLNQSTLTAYFSRGNILEAGEQRPCDRVLHPTSLATSQSHCLAVTTLPMMKERVCVFHVSRGRTVPEKTQVLKMHSKHAA